MFILRFKSYNVNPEMEGEVVDSYFPQSYLHVRECNARGWKLKPAFWLLIPRLYPLNLPIMKADNTCIPKRSPF